MLNALQKATAEAIVNIFETGRVIGDYGQVTLLTGDTGHLTYGKAQTTLASGNLETLIRAYCAAPGARLASELSRFLDRIAVIDLTLDHDREFRDLLREAGDDPVMHAQQDSFFDRVYWQPAIKSADYIGAKTPLGVSVIYDSRIHGSWHARRDQTIADFGRLTDKGEEAWIARYVTVRRHWLATHANSLLHKTTYRMDTFNTLIAADAWSLPLPLTVRGLRIDEASLKGDPPLRVSAADPGQRTLKLTTPPMRGPDVKRLQEALAATGIAIGTDGVFGQQSADAVRAFQQRAGLTADGIAGPATFAALYEDD